ncbi:hypothetical protein [Neobacillus soli]|uniref:hypothetical protein n=1 Tax=Neobacillus soli TaxID=220688 RepID=UPI0008243C69|nr:hypothetical protein [Neobacillus soli]
MSKKFSEEDFAALRGPLESGRQSPGSLGGILFLSVFLQCLMFYLTYYVAARSSIYPNIALIEKIHFWVTAILVTLSILYSLPFIYRSSQKVQYLLSILVSQNLGGACIYLAALFLVGEQENLTKESLVNFTYATLIIGALIFIVTVIRFYILLNKGTYSKGSKRDEWRESVENKLPSYLPIIITGSIGLVFVIQYLVRFSHFEDIEEMGMIVLAFAIFYTMLFVLPEQLVILYCKFRFKSFNYDRNGYLQTDDRIGKGC